MGSSTKVVLQAHAQALYYQKWLSTFQPHMVQAPQHKHRTSLGTRLDQLAAVQTAVKYGITQHHLAMSVLLIEGAYSANQHLIDQHSQSPPVH